MEAETREFIQRMKDEKRAFLKGKATAGATVTEWETHVITKYTDDPKSFPILPLIGMAMRLAWQADAPWEKKKGASDDDDDDGQMTLRLDGVPMREYVVVPDHTSRDGFRKVHVSAATLHQAREDAIYCMSQAANMTAKANDRLKVINNKIAEAGGDQTRKIIDFRDAPAKAA